MRKIGDAFSRWFYLLENSLSSVIHLTLSKENLVKNIMNLHPFSLALLLLNSIKRTEEENIMKALL